MTKKGPDSRDVEVGRRVRMFRLQKGLSQEKLGDALGLTFQQVQKYEKGTNRIASGRLRAIAEALELPVTFFFVGNANERSAVTPDGETPMDYLRTEGVLKLVRAFSQIEDTAAKASVIAIVEHLASAHRTRKRGRK